jgi:hypothetical protein
MREAKDKQRTNNNSHILALSGGNGLGQFSRSSPWILNPTVGLFLRGSPASEWSFSRGCSPNLWRLSGTPSVDQRVRVVAGGGGKLETILIWKLCSYQNSPPPGVPDFLGSRGPSFNSRRAPETAACPDDKPGPQIADGMPHRGSAEGGPCSAKKSPSPSRTLPQPAGASKLTMKFIPSGASPTSAPWMSMEALGY